MGTVKNVVLFLALAFFVAQLTERVGAQHRSRQENCGQVDVVLYTTARCGYCARARRFLNRNDIAWCEKDINRSDSHYREFKSLGGSGVPLALFGRKPGGGGLRGQVLRGFSEEAYADAFLSR